MPNVCLLCGSRGGSKSNLSFHRFPKDIERCNEWFRLCRLTQYVSEAFPQSFRLCSSHFDSSQYTDGKLRQDAMPSLLPQPDLPDEDIEPLSFLGEVVLNLQDPSTVDRPHSPTWDHSSYSISTNNSTSVASTQTDQKLTSKTKQKNKLHTKLLHYKNSFKEVSKNYNLLKAEYEKSAYSSSTLGNFHLLCDKFLKKGVSNFIKVQSQLMFTNPHGNKHSYETKLFSLMVHFFGPKVYRFLQKSWCLPSIRTLHRITQNWEINPGLNDFLFKVLSLKSNSMALKSKECVLCVDEMSLKSFLFYNFKRDEIIGFHDTGFFKSSELAKSVMVAMICGLHDSWKQPVGYFFVANSCAGDDLQNIIFSLISKLNSISFNVQVMISDLGSNFKMFADQLHISHETPYFYVGDKEIVYMFDPTHLLKATRNNFFKYKFQSGNQIAEKIHLQKFYESDKSHQHQLAPKLTDVHLNPNYFQKMKVKYATQIFSQTVVAGMRTLIASKQLCNTAVDTINFIDSMDKLFDIFNSHPLSKDISDINIDGLNRFRLPFENSDFQTKFLNAMIGYLKNLKLLNFSVTKNEWVSINKQYDIKFIHGWLVSIAGLIRLYHNQTKIHSTHSQLFTYRLNQDCLEKFFGTVRIQNGNCHNPTSIQFKRTYKKLFCVNYLEHIEDANCVQDLDDILASLDKTPIDEMKALFSEKNPIKIPLSINELTDDYKHLNLPEQNTLTYICGYLIGQCLKFHECLVCLNYAASTTKLSSYIFYSHYKAYLKKPSSDFSNLMMPDSTFCKYIIQLNKIFDSCFISLAPEPKVGQILKDKMYKSIFFHHPCKDFPKSYMINLFLRFRIYNTLRSTNKDCHASKTGKLSRKIQIFSNL